MSIDSCYENVIAKLTSEGKIQAISKTLLSCSTNDERVLYVYDLLGSLKVLPKLQEVKKTDAMSIYYRNHGNQCFQKREDYKAWQYYNLSLLHAPVGSESYCMALSNRSAVFYTMKKVKECLQDIMVIYSMQYPEKLKEKLFNRQSACEEWLLKEESLTDIKAGEIEKILTLDDKRDPRYPCASTKLQVVYNKEMGRHVIAKEDIKVGEILIQEDPYFTLLLKTQILFSCSYCLSRNLHLLPCPSCCFALYCSEECRKNAWTDYHSVECSLMATLIHMDFTKLELLALRTVIKARKDHPDWPSLLQTVHIAECNMDTEFRGHVKINERWVYDSKYYSSIHTLASNIERRTVSDIFQKSITAAVFLHFLNIYTDFMQLFKDLQGDEIVKLVSGSLLLHIMTSPTNMHGLSANIQTVDGNYIDEVNLASAPYAYHSLLNHSCAPNVVRFGKLGTGQMTLYALRPIKKGMQLFDNYGSHHALQTLKERQETLKAQYKFTCECEACVNDWPTYPCLTRFKLPADILDLKDKLLDSDAIENLQKGDKNTALKLFKPLCDMIGVLEAYAPCGELADCQESMKQCLAILRGVVPYGYSNIVDWVAVLKLNEMPTE